MKNTSVRSLFDQLSISAGAAAPPSKRASAVKRKCPLWRGSPAEPRGSRGPAGHLAQRCSGLGVSLVSPAVWCPGASTQKRASPGLLPFLSACSSLPRQEALLLEGAPRQQIKALHKEEKKKKSDQGIQEKIPTCLKVLVHPKHKCQHYLVPGKYRGPKIGTQIMTCSALSYLEGEFYYL